MRANAGRIGLLLTLAASGLLAGCSGRSIHVLGVGDVLRQNVRVDVVGVNWVEKQQWETVSMQDYWSEGNQRREDSIRQGYNLSLAFSPDSPCDITIKDSDPLWQIWEQRKATHFLVLFDTCSDSKAWRLCLPLSRKCWDRSAAKKIEVAIQPSGVIPQTAPKAKCKEG
jgi:hypothetical protein